MLPGRKPGDKLQVWSTVNFKGGSAKTTTTITLAQRLALRGYRVLCIDADPQASLTTFFGYQPEIDFFEGGTLYDAIRYRNAETGEGPKRLSEVVRKSYFHNLDIVPGGILLSEFEHETPTALSRVEQPVFFQRIAHALDDVESDYDLVLIDCPPQLGYVTLSAVCASTSLLMTVIPDRIDIASAAQFLRMAAGLVEVLSDSGGITDYDNFLFLLTRFDTAISAQQDLAEYMRALFKDQVLETPFLKSSAISDAGLGQRTVFEAEITAGTRRTYERAIASATGVCNDVERRIQAAWGRQA
jgi:chromosome partitioning protein